MNAICKQITSFLDEHALAKKVPANANGYPDSRDANFVLRGIVVQAQKFDGDCSGKVERRGMLPSERQKKKKRDYIEKKSMQLLLILTLPPKETSSYVYL